MRAILATWLVIGSSMGACGGAVAPRGTTAPTSAYAGNAPTPPAPTPDAKAPASADAVAIGNESARTETTWASMTQSPWTTGEDERRDPRERALAAICGAEDAALTRVAREIVAVRARGLGVPNADAVIARLRAAGEPHVRPRIVVAAGRAPMDPAAITAELTGGRSSGESRAPSRLARAASRCGVAIAPTPHGGEVLVALRVEALADLSPLPTRARTGEWLTFEARLHVGARTAALVVLGPRGAPRTVPTTLDPITGIARARFVLDQPGAFTVQLSCDLMDGPRPLLEARVFADVTPTIADDEAAPGETEGSGDDDAASLAKMIDALRAFEGSPPLARSARLDALARAHAERMREGRAVAHDVGDGDFRERFEAEGSLDARAVGENVAHATTVTLAHRALYASPSHRMNLLRADYTHMGIGVIRAPDGSVYVCETFVAARPAETAR